MKTTIPFTLTLFTSQDYADYRSLTSSPQIMEMITGAPLSEQESVAHFDRILQQNEVAANFGNFKIIHRDTGEFMGLAKIVMEQPGDTEVEIGFMLRERFQHKGIASAATHQLIDFVRGQKSIIRIKAVLDPLNKASRRILVNEGFVSEFVGEPDGVPLEIMSLTL